MNTKQKNGRKVGTLTIALSFDEIKKIKEQAALDDRSVSSLIRIALRKAGMIGSAKAGTGRQ